MTGFSHELLHKKREATKNHCQILKLEVDVIEGHHALLKSHGGSNNPKNCIMLSGYDSYSVYGIKVPDVHEEADQMGIRYHLYLHPDTLEYVTKDELPIECFKDCNRDNYGIMPEVRTKNKKHHKKNR